MISSPHPATKLLYDVSRQWIQYLNRCVDASASEVVEAPKDSVPFSLEPILVDLDGGRYMGPILPGSLEDFLVGRRAEGGNSSGGGGGGGGDAKQSKVGATGGGRARGCGLIMICTCPPCPFGTGRNCGHSQQGRSSPPCISMLFSRTGTCAGRAGRNVSVKTCTSLPPLRRRTPSPSYSKCLGGNDLCACSLVVAGCLPHLTPRPCWA